VVPETAGERAALENEVIRAQVLEEVNVKSLELAESSEGLMRVEVRANLARLGPRYGKNLGAIREHLSAVDPAAVQAAVASGGTYSFETQGQTFDLSEEDVEVLRHAQEGRAILEDEGAFVALDTTITPELAREGLARDFVRGVQRLRKDMDLNVADRIRLRYRSEAEPAQAVEEWSDYIKRETLALELTADDSLAEDGGQAFRAGGAKIVVALTKAE
jgi:isoleucyl-tRNA synthetase